MCLFCLSWELIGSLDSFAVVEGVLVLLELTDCLAALRLWSTTEI